jgi:DNA-binding transcriptional LysR family regulator
VDPDWDDLRIFLTVARFDSLSAAGRHLKLDPATVGRRIARLEEVLGAALFTKSPQGYALSGQGQELLAHAERVEQAVSAGRQAVRGEAGPLTGQIRVGAPDGCATFVLPQVCAAIARENPDLDIQIVALPRVVNLSKREADMAIAVSQPSTGRLTVQKITDYHLHLAAHRDYLAGAPAIGSLADLRRHPIVGYIPDMIFDKELDYLSEAGADRVGLASNSVVVQFNLLRQRAGVGIVHDFALPTDPAIRTVLPDSFSLTRSFYLVRHLDDRRVERLNRFAARLADGLRAEVQRLEAIS